MAMQIKAINPNTNWDMTENIGEVANEYVAEDTEVVAVSPERGPVTIESYYDHFLVIPGLLEEIIEDEDEYDAFVVACWADSGIEACREVTDKPVVGIAEASLYVANMLGATYSVATILSRAKDLIEDTVDKAGMGEHCASVRTTQLNVDETCGSEAGRQKTVDELLEACRLAIEEDGAEAICLGCAGMGGLAGELETELGVPVVDSVGAGAVLAESLVQLGHTTSDALTFRPPESKEIKGYPDIYQQ